MSRVKITTTKYVKKSELEKNKNQQKQNKPLATKTCPKCKGKGYIER